MLRPGRFDRRITLDRPDMRGREAILKVHARGKPFSPSVDLGSILDALLRDCPPAPAAAVPAGSPRLRFVAALTLAGRCPDDSG